MGRTKATDALLKDHLLINKILEQFSLDNPRFEKICLTLHRAVRAHAWFEEEDALFPLTEHLLTEEGLIELGDEMQRRQTEVRQFIEI